MTPDDPSLEVDSPDEQGPGRAPRDVQRRPLSSRVVTIGRSKAADIRLRDGRLSRKHCQIIPVGQDYLISDLDSRNGTVVNGKTVSKRVLRPGDCISLGGFRLDFTGDSLIITEDLDTAGAAETSGTGSHGPVLATVTVPGPELIGPPPELVVEAPEVEAPEAPAPEVEPPSVETPEVEAPEVETPAPALEPTAEDEAAARLAAYLQGMGADAALLQKAMGHLGVAVDAPAPLVVAPPVVPADPSAPAAPTDPDDPALVPARFDLVRPGAVAGPAASLLVPPPPGLSAADPFGETQSLRGPTRERRLARLIATARVRGGAAGLAVGLHIGVLVLLSAIVLVAAQFGTGEAVQLSVAAAPEAAFERETRPPAMPPPPSTRAAEARIAAAVAEAGRIELGDWHVESGPDRPELERVPGAIALASRFEDTTTRAPSAQLVPALFAQRFEPLRSQVLKRAKASAQLAPAVDRALAWLVAHQRPDGLWSAGAQRCGHPECQAIAGDPAYDVGVTGLALLVIAGQGEGGRTGAYGEPVSRALAALGRRTQGDGWIGERRGKGVYNHLLATLGAMEIAAVTGRPSARTLARAGLRALDAHRVDATGWRYRADRGEADTAVTTWAGIAYAVATRLGWKPSSDSLRTAVDWTRRMYDPGTTRVGYLLRGDGGSRFAEAVHDFPRAGAMSGAGATLLLLAGVPADDTVVRGALTDVAQHVPVTQVRDCYAWQFGAQALHQVGGDAWRTYAVALEEAVLPLQVAEGGAAGLFPIMDAWTSAGGHVYATAMCTLALQAHYRYARVSELDR